MRGLKVVAVPDATLMAGPYMSAWTRRPESVLPYSVSVATVSPMAWIFYLAVEAPESHVASLMLEGQTMAVLLVETDAETMPIERVAKRTEDYTVFWEAARTGQEPSGVELGLVIPLTRATPNVVPLRVLWRAKWDNSYGQHEALGTAMAEARGAPVPMTDKNVWFPIAGG